MIELKNVNKKYKNIILFKNINLIIPSNKKILIKGINGSGKSVFLKLLVGYSNVDSGKIIIDGLTLKEDTDFIQNAGVFINAPEFIKDLTGLENLEYLAKIRKVADREKILDYAQKLNFKNEILKKYKTYSLGMKQKMRFIQAVMDQPKYLILDEPFDALDNKSQLQIIDILNEYIKIKNNTLIFTSHNSKYEDFADIIYEIDNYKIKVVKS